MTLDDYRYSDHNSDKLPKCLLSFFKIVTFFCNCITLSYASNIFKLRNIKNIKKQLKKQARMKQNHPTVGFSLHPSVVKISIYIINILITHILIFFPICILCQYPHFKKPLIFIFHHIMISD